MKFEILVDESNGKDYGCICKGRMSQGRLYIDSIEYLEPDPAAAEKIQRAIGDLQDAVAKSFGVLAEFLGKDRAE